MFVMNFRGTCFPLITKLQRQHRIPSKKDSVSPHHWGYQWSTESTNINIGKERNGIRNVHQCCPLPPPPPSENRLLIVMAKNKPFIQSPLHDCQAAYAGASGPQHWSLRVLDTMVAWEQGCPNNNTSLPVSASKTFQLNELVSTKWQRPRKKKE